MKPLTSKINLDKSKFSLDTIKNVAISIGTVAIGSVALLVAGTLVSWANSSNHQNFSFDDEEEPDQSYAAEDYISSRPWGIDNDGY